jgi:hypothetical protein
MNPKLKLALASAWLLFLLVIVFFLSRYCWPYLFKSWQETPTICLQSRITVK